MTGGEPQLGAKKREESHGSNMSMGNEKNVCQEF